MSEFYDGTKLLSMKDLNGKEPEIFLCTTNRSAGKTTYFSRLCVNKYLEGKGKFCLVYRYNYELSDVANKFFKDIQGLFFPDMTLETQSRARGMYHELYLDEQPCGYAISLNNADGLKKYSHLLSDVERMFFDEFQSETNHYCPDEIRKLISVHTSIARGQGKPVRYVPLYMCGNTVTLINPYYVALGISNRLKTDTKFLRGDGYVLEQGFLENISQKQQESAFNRAFASDKYIAYSTQGVYLNDNVAFIEHPQGNSRYLATLRSDNVDYAVREYPELGIIYCDDKSDKSFRSKLSVTTESHEINYVMLRSNRLFLDTLRYYFERGCFRFKNMQCKGVILKALSF